MGALAGLLTPSLSAPSLESASKLSLFETALARRAEGMPHRADLGDASMTARGAGPAERQALWREKNRVLLALDGRLDNREEVRRLLDRPAPRASDAELVAALYGRLGLRTFEALIGDYAVSLWDERSQRLVLARDPFGTRPLYYVPGSNASHRATPEAPGQWLWASSLEALLAVSPALADDLDDEWIAGFLTSGLPKDRSVYAAVRTVPPGHFLCFDRRSGRRETHRFWRPEELAPTVLGSDADYEERYLELFTEAVACRMHAPGSVFAELSGGLDSSSIVTVADQLLRRGAVPSDQVETLSYVFDRSKTSDERRWIRPVEEQTGRPAHHLVEEERPYLQDFENAVWASPSVMTSLGPRLNAAAERMRRVGCKTLLSGLAGDQVASGDYLIPPQLGDLAAQRRWLALGAELRRWRNHGDNPHVHLFLHGVVHNLVPRSLRLRLRRQPQLMPWIDDGFASRHDTHARYEGAPQAAKARFDLPSQRARFDVIQHISHGAVTAMNDDYGRYGITQAYPFLDRRLVEYCLTIPSEQYCRPGEQRSLVRRAMRDLLPDEVCNRPDKQGPDEAMLRAFIRQWPKIYSLFQGDAEVYERGYVDRKRLLDALARRRAGDASTNRTEMVIYLEVWLRHHRQRSATVRAA